MELAAFGTRLQVSQNLAQLLGSLSRRSLIAVSCSRRAIVSNGRPVLSLSLQASSGGIARTLGRASIDGSAELGYLRCGPNGAGHFVKMLHNGIEYGVMAAYAEGLAVLRSANRIGPDVRQTTASAASRVRRESREEWI